jgi:hyperosmotically inducible periplasmic protein
MTSRKTAGIDTLALAALLALAAPAACAGGSYAYDANHDGYVSRDEWRRLGGDPAVFRGSDADHDGRLDRDEIVKAMSWDERVKAAEYAGDAWITAKVKAALLMDEAIRASRVSVVTRDGTVELSGVVRSDAEARQAARLASQVEGVRKVINSLTVKRS